MPELLEAYASGDNKLMWDRMKVYVFGDNKLYSGLLSRRVAEYLLFTAETPEEIETAYNNTYESINEKYRDEFYKENDLIEIRNRIRTEDQDGLYAINNIIEHVTGEEIEKG